MPTFSRHFTSLKARRSRIVPAGNRHCVPYNTTSSTNNVRNGRLAYVAPSFYGVKSLIVTYVNWQANPTAADASAGLTAYNLRTSLEYPAGTFTQITFGGSVTKQVQPGDTVDSDPISVTIPAGATYYIRTYQEQTGVSPYTVLVNQMVEPSRGDGLMSGTDNSVDRTMSGTVSAVSAPASYIGPALVRGSMVGGGASVLIIGDSIARGTGDSSASPVGQGDYLASTSPAAPYQNFGNHGWIERAVGARNGIFSLAVPGKFALYFTEALNLKGFALADKIAPTHVIIQSGINDLRTSGVTGADLVARTQAIVAVCRARWPRAKVFVATLMPLTASTDGYVTKTNQAFSGTVYGSTPPWTNFTDNTGTSGRSYYNAQARLTRFGADGCIDVAAQVQDATDERYWRSDVGATTADGLHPNQAGVIQALNALNPTLLFG